MDQLPIELCQTIFSLAANYPTPLRSTDRFSEQAQKLARTAYCLAAVSRHWRDIGTTHSRGVDAHCRIVPSGQRWTLPWRECEPRLRRAGSVPAAVHSICFFSDDTKADGIDELFDLVSEHASRWRQWPYRGAQLHHAREASGRRPGAISAPGGTDPPAAGRKGQRTKWHYGV